MAYSKNQHAEWLSLIEVSGPFLAEPILDQAFPQGLEKLDPIKKRQFRQTYDEWREVIDSDTHSDIEIKDKIHQQWIDWVLKFGLELDEDEDGDVLKNQSQMSSTIQVHVTEHHVSLKPDYAIIASDAEKPYLLIQTYPPETKLSEVLPGDGWSTSPAERMAHLCRGIGTRLGIITNGEQWMFIDAPIGGITTYASWYARLWGLEPITLQAFYSLFNVGIVFNGFNDAKSLPALIDESLQYQEDVTHTLGTQVSRAVEVLIQSIDRINHDHNGRLLKGVEPEELYEAGLTFMMRLVFLLCAEERGLLLLGDQAYEANYALSTLRAKLREEASLHGDEVLSYRKNAWSRLLAIFRAVYAGVEHENMRMPALGGSLFDPDRFPFLEGRGKGSNWLEEQAKPLPIDNRTVLLFLDAIQLYQGRTLSYRALDVEQIGYVYEGLLEQTVKRAPDVTLELSGSKSCKKPLVYLGELASAELDGNAALQKLLKERTGSSASRITNDLKKEVTDADIDKLMVACYNDAELCKRIKPYYHFLRFDAWGNPLLYPKGAYMLTTGSDRRETGSHYTPKSLTESIVKETLEPVVYIGPAEGKPREEWELKSPEALLDLKICDPAMGSGAFLVQVCRWLAERVCESWIVAEKNGARINSRGFKTFDETEELAPNDTEERLLLARRLISERCLYGVDINPLAVELAKLSIWLITLSKDKPFGFLDHNFKSGDSLLGIHNLKQIYCLDLNVSKKDATALIEQPFAIEIKRLISDCIKIREKIASHETNLLTDIDELSLLESLVKKKSELPKLIADALIGLNLENKKEKTNALTALSCLIRSFNDNKSEVRKELKKLATDGLSKDLASNSKIRVPFHWCIEFPEVFINGGNGFDAIVGNPPYLGNSSIKKAFGEQYRIFCVNNLIDSRKGKSDLVVFFFAKILKLLSSRGVCGLLSTDSISHGDSKSVGLDYWLSNGISIFSAHTSEKWKGEASVVTHRLHLANFEWLGKRKLNDKYVNTISSSLTPFEETKLLPLKENVGLVFKGTEPGGEGFLLSDEEAKILISKNPSYKEILFPYLIARQINQDPKQSTNRWIINFWDWNEARSRNFDTAFKIVEEKVKPVRTRLKENGAFALDRNLAINWWLFARNRPALYCSIGRGVNYEAPSNKKLSKDSPEKFDNVIVFARGASKYCCFSMIENDKVFGDSLCVIASSSFSLFAILSSDIHASWAWQNGGRKSHDLRYIQDAVFETFPFPKEISSEFENNLYSSGLKFHEKRKEIMEDRTLSLTKVYNLFHDPLISTNEIVDLREKQISINNAVLSAYGLNHIIPDYDFHEVDYLPVGKNIRFTISEKARFELLQELSLLNNYRAKEEI